MYLFAIIFLLIAFWFQQTPVQDSDILDYARQHARDSQVQNPDGTWRVPEFGDVRLERAVNELKHPPRPWTVPKVIAWYQAATDTKDTKQRANWLRVLAASRDPRAALILGKALSEEEEIEIRVAAIDGLHGYFIEEFCSMSSEQAALCASRWWAMNEARLKQEAARFKAKVKQ